MEINLFFEGVDSYHGFQSKMIREIQEQIPLHRVVLTDKQHDGEDCFDDKLVRLINYDICEHNRYEELVDFNDLIPLSRELLESMKPYESTAIQMLIRNFERDVYTYDEAKQLYLKHLRFWNHIFVTEKLNMVCFNNIPHHCHDYVIYCLALVYHTGLRVCSDTSIPPRLATGRRLDLLWEKTYRRYLELKDIQTVELPEDLEHYYQALLYANEGMDKGAVNRGMSRKHHIEVRRKTFEQYFTLENQWKRRKHLIKLALTQDFHENMDKLAQEQAICKRARIKLKSMRNIKYYNSLTQEPVEGETYIVYFLHLQPEATTLPQGGVFVEQELMIQILAAAAEKHGIKVYVKEHFVQPCRNKSFYDGLAKIRNVRLIHSDKDSKHLAKNSIATASCNGTIMLESIFNGKPTICFGNTVFQKAPGVYHIGNVEECEQVLQQIENGQAQIQQKQVRAYLKAFGENSMRAYFDCKLYENDNTITLEEGIAAYADYVVKGLREEFEDDE